MRVQLCSGNKNVDTTAHHITKEFLMSGSSGRVDLTVPPASSTLRILSSTHTMPRMPCVCWEFSCTGCVCVCVCVCERECV